MLEVLEAKTKENETKEIARKKKYKTTFWTRETELSVLKGTQASSSMKEKRFTPRYIFMKFYNSRDNKKLLEVFREKILLFTKDQESDPLYTSFSRATLEVTEGE